jgi:glycosyltransferase involved in cell wall biosynthesis
MKILFVSMPSVHVIRWIENLKDTSHELYWFDVLGRGRLATLDSVTQFVDWKKRKLKYIKGEYFLSKKFPDIYERVQPFLEVTANEVLENIINEIQPNLVHSFEMQGCSYPILKTMRKYPDVKWLYSCWGNDLYYYQQFSIHLKKINRILSRVNYLHTDCNRDFELAIKLGFQGKHVGVIPGGTGYHLQELEPYKLPVVSRNIILVKGYEHHLGRGLNIVKALQEIQDQIQHYEVVVFGAHQKVIDYIRTEKLYFTVFDRHELSHDELLKLMGKSLIYIGNSISDGMPNTLLEAIVMGAFPIQSNPGGVTEEIIIDGENGFLIEDSESEVGIQKLVLTAVSNRELLNVTILKNGVVANERLGFSDNKIKVINIYDNILKCE